MYKAEGQKIGLILFSLPWLSRMYCSLYRVYSLLPLLVPEEKCWCLQCNLIKPRYFVNPTEESCFELLELFAADQSFFVSVSIWINTFFVRIFTLHIFTIWYQPRYEMDTGHGLSSLEARTK